MNKHNHRSGKANLTADGNTAGLAHPEYSHRRWLNHVRTRKRWFRQVRTVYVLVDALLSMLVSTRKRRTVEVCRLLDAAITSAEYSIFVRPGGKRRVLDARDAGRVLYIGWPESLATRLGNGMISLYFHLFFSCRYLEGL